jgi:hypothetical protein
MELDRHRYSGTRQRNRSSNDSSLRSYDQRQLCACGTALAALITPETFYPYNVTCRQIPSPRTRFS